LLLELGFCSLALGSDGSIPFLHHPLVLCFALGALTLFLLLKGSTIGFELGLSSVENKRTAHA